MSESHRHLVAIDSPPDDYEFDKFIEGPVLPVGWTGDSWVRPEPTGYFLRAWSKSTSEWAVENGDKYVETRDALVARIRNGLVKKATITFAEVKVRLPK